MASIFPLGGYVVVGLSIAEFFSGILKAAKPCSKYGIHCVLVFGTCELVLGMLLGASIITQVTTLKYWHSKALYLMAVVSDFLFLFVDLLWAFFWILDEQVSGGKPIEWNRERIKEAIENLSILILVFSVPIVLLILLFGRLRLSIVDVSVSDLSDSATPPPFFWFPFAGFIVLVLSIMLFFALFALNYEKLNESLLFSFYFTLSVGTTMIVGTGLRVPQQFARGYALISITTLPPAMSFLFTFFKLFTIDGLGTSSLNENSKQPNGESNEQDAILLC